MMVGAPFPLQHSRITHPSQQAAYESLLSQSTTTEVASSSWLVAVAADLYAGCLGNTAV